MIPITYFADPKLQLFYNSHHFTNTTDYLTLVLVKESHPAYAYCQERMIKLDMQSNPFLKLDFELSQFQYCNPNGFNLWVELFVPGDVQLMNSTHTWDTVEDKGRHVTTANFG